jgi:serine protease Do
MWQGKRRTEHCSMAHRRRFVSVCTAIGLSLLHCHLWSAKSIAQDRQLLKEAKEREAKAKKVAELGMKATVALGSFGSGIVVSEDGYIVTAAHNHDVDSDKALVKVIFADGTTIDAKRFGGNYANDLGLLKIVGEGKWPHIPLGKVDAPKPGEWCMALGYAGGHGAWRSKPSVRVGRLIRFAGDMFITDCACISGDSGGPLLNLSGQLIGIHSSIGNSVAVNRHFGVHMLPAQWNRLLAGHRWGRLSGSTEPSEWDEKSTRGRKLHELEKQHPSVLREFLPVARSVRSSVTSIEVQGRTVALGTIIDGAGGVVTTASELNGATAVTCVLFDGARHSATVSGVDEESDLALLVIKGVKTSSVKWVKAETPLGATLLTTTPAGEVASLGFLSYGPLSMKEFFQRGEPEWFRPQMIRLGAVPSRRLTGFSEVIQHDSPLYPEQCGGPLLDLNGDAVGVNIARFGRVESFAIPADIAQTVIAKMKRAAQK